MSSRGPFDAVFESSRPISPTARHLRFRRADGAPMAFRPGQFVMFHFETASGTLDRSYSLASAPDGSDALELGITFLPDGRGAQRLDALRPGDRVRASGPHGRFVLRDESVARYILVATGTGVGPYRAMLPSLAERFASTDLRVHLVFGCRTVADVLYRDDFEAFAEAHSAFTWEVRLSRPVPEGSPAWMHEGRVQSAFASLELDPTRDVVYLCGNPNMIDDATACLVESGYSPYAVRREKYTSA